MYGSKYEELARLQIFVNNRNTITKHNQKFARYEVSYQMAINQFSDLTSAEFLDRMTAKSLNLSEIAYDVTFIGAANVELPVSVDWRSRGAVTPVKDQGRCLSFWAFSATGALEGQQFRKTQRLVSLSEQNLLDCSTDRGNHGCRGGMMNTGFEYVKKNGGIDTEDSYPYKGVQRRCSFNRKNIGASCKGVTNIPRGDEAKLMNAAATVGPIAVAINVGDTFHHYHSGVYYEPRCSETKLNHAALVIGYGTEFGHDFWLVKNSWGTSWGHDGYIKMARNKKNNCGIASVASYPLL